MRKFVCEPLRAFGGVGLLLAALAAFGLFPCTAEAGVTSSGDVGLIEFRSYPDEPVAGENMTLTVRFRYGLRPQDGTLVVSVTDAEGKALRSWSLRESDGEQRTYEGASEWRTSVTFKAESGMRRAFLRWSAPGGGGETKRYEESISLIREKSAEDGLVSYRVTSGPAYLGDYMTTTARFNREPDAGSVYMVLRQQNGSLGGRFEYDDARRSEGLYQYRFRFRIGEGKWRSTLHWRMNGRQYSRDLSFSLESERKDESLNGCSTGLSGLMGLAVVAGFLLLRRR